jgi:uncharacterized protein
MTSGHTSTDSRRSNYVVQPPARALRGPRLNTALCALSPSLDGHLHCRYSVRMSALRFEWDPAKAAANRRKHRISFEEAKTIFLDESAVLIDDPDHSRTEERSLLVGLSARLQVLTASHCYRKADEVIRIISARKATPHEREAYKKRWGK